MPEKGLRSLSGTPTSCIRKTFEKNIFYKNPLFQAPHGMPAKNPVQACTL